MSVKELPHFASEAEEAAWWYDNREQHSEEFARAFDEGRVKPSRVAQRLAALRGEATVLLTMPIRDTEIAAKMAEEKGIQVNQYLVNLLHAALEHAVSDAA